MLDYLLLFISITLAVSGQLLMKYGINTFGKFPASEFFGKLLSIILNPFVFTGLSLFVISAGFWIIVLSRFDLSMVYPMVAFGYVVAAIASVFLFGEVISPIRWAGIVTIVVGVILISRSN